MITKHHFSLPHMEGIFQEQMIIEVKVIKIFILIFEI